MPDSGNESPKVPIVCPECETSSRIPLSDVADTLEQHNDEVHAGKEFAKVEPAVMNHVQDIIIDDLDLREL